MREFYRVLKPSGTLAFSELLPDPDYPLVKSLVRMAAQANFRLKRKLGNFFAYTLLFEKVEGKVGFPGAGVLENPSS
jgi:ubiquinone/menaquinone biosynthesis C-methylase UbiE